MRGILSLDVVAPSFGHQSLLNGILSEEIQLTTCYLSSPPPLIFSPNYYAKYALASTS